MLAKYFVFNWRVWLLPAMALTVACQAHAPPSAVNVELIGRWSDGQACTAELAMVTGQLELRQLDASAQHLRQQALISWKDGVISKFKAANPQVDFSGSYSEGLMLIDDKYCQQALHKINNS